MDKIVIRFIVSLNLL